MALDLNDPELELSDLVTAYQSWVIAVINDEKLGGEKLLTDEIAVDPNKSGSPVTSTSNLTGVMPFVFLSRNSQRASSFVHIPAEQVVEIGVVEI
mgnify:CR=1 FL=1